jgi:hypothetical protein
MSPIKTFYAEIPINAKVVRKVLCPLGFCGNVFVSNDKFIIPILYDPYQPDEDWEEQRFKVLSNEDEYTIGSYQYLSSIEFKGQYYNIMRLM